MIRNNKKPIIRNSGLIGQPSLKLSATAANRARNVGPNADDYYSIRVSTDDASITEPVTVVLFDASAGYQENNNLVMHPGIVIEGIHCTYQFLLNDISQNTPVFDIIRAKSNDGSSGFDTQFDRPVETYYTSPGQGTRQTGRMFPDKGIHEGQFQEKIVTFKYPHAIDHRSAWVYKQEPGKVITWSFYLAAEIGLQQ